MLSVFGLDKQLGLQTLIKTTEVAVITQTSIHETSGLTRDAHCSDAKHAWCGQFGNGCVCMKQRTRHDVGCMTPHLTRTVQRVRDTARKVLAPIRARYAFSKAVPRAQTLFSNCI